MGDEKADEVTPHVLIFPLPIQSPVNCMLKLAEILCLSNIKVTFLNSQHIQKCLFKNTNTENYFRRYPNFRFETIPDGLPGENARTAPQLRDLLLSMEAVGAPIFEEIVKSEKVGVSCIIAEALLSFPSIVANKIGIPFLCFDTLSPCAIWTHLSLPKLIQSGQLPFKDDNLEEMIGNVAGLEGILRRRDLPSFCRAPDFINDPDAQLFFKEINNISQSQTLILNTFHHLDAPILSQILTVCPNIYAIGPLQAHLKARLASEAGPEIQPVNSNSIWKEDKSCISWLNQQPSSSVIYVSIGSLAMLTKDQFFEIWHGLVNSGSRFLWVQRPGSVVGLESEPGQIPWELTIGTEERGCVVSWAPQEEVLAHPAVGAFFTHSGWNSTLESIIEAKPMICWAYFIDQQVNSRFVGHVWKIGLDMKDSCDRVTIEKMVKEVMEFRKDELLERAKEMAKMARSSVTQGGSSFADMDRLIHDIKMMKLPM